VKDYKKTPKILMPPIGVQKLENPQSNLEKDTNGTFVGLNHKAYQI
jgi:hypothetical protein